METRITEELSDVKYFVHWSHCLKQVIVNVCQNVPEDRNFMTILEKTTWLTNGSSKTKNIMKSKLNLPAENQLEFHMLYDEEEYIFDQEQRCLLAFCDVRWTSRADILTCLLKHYSTMKRFLQEIQDKTSGYSDATSYKSML